MTEDTGNKAYEQRQVEFLEPMPPDSVNWTLILRGLPTKADDPYGHAASARLQYGESMGCV